MWEQGRALFALLAWFLESEDERLLRYARGIVTGLLGLTERQGPYRVFVPAFFNQLCFGDILPGMLAEPLLKYYQVSGDGDALDLAEGFVRWAASPESRLLDEQHRISGNLRGLGACVAGMARFAAYADDPALLDWVERLFRQCIGYITAYGGTPDGEPCCSLMEWTTIALALTGAGRGEWWDLIDRYFRNHTLANQFTDTSRANRAMSTEAPRPQDDARDALERAVGCFMCASAREHHGGTMLCCTGNAMWTLGKLASEAVTLDEGGLAVNLHFSLETPLAAITSCEPFAGRLEVAPHRAGPLRVRVPAYAGRVEAAVDGTPAQPEREGAYLHFGEVRAGQRVTLTFDLPEKDTVETTWLTPGGRADVMPKRDPVLRERVRTRWRGNTVLAIDYDEDSPEPLHRLYWDRLARFRREEGKDDRAAFFLPEKAYHW
jgi:hypothetical protein